MQKNIYKFIPNTVFSVIIFSMFSIGSYGTPLPLFHLSQHFFLDVKRQKKKKTIWNAKSFHFSATNP